MKRKSNNEGSIRQRKDGRWEVRATAGMDYNTGKPKRISRYAKTKPEAIKILHELEYQIHHMKQIDPTSTTLLEWLTFWLQTYKASSIKQSTYVSYQTYINNHIAVAFPKMKLKDLTTRNLQEFYNFKLASGLSPKSILNIHRCLHNALKQAVLEHYIPFNPSDAVVLPKCVKPEIAVLTCEEQAQLINTSYRFRYGILIRLALSTGMRLGEILGLKWKNIDLKSNIIFVRQTLNRLNKIDYNGIGTKTEIVIQTPKTQKSIRSIPIMGYMKYELPQWRKIQQLEKTAAGTAYQDLDFVAANPLGGYIEPRTFKDYYNEILAASGIGHFTFHALRHTFCTRALENGIDPITVSSYMGHYSAAFTLDTYGHVLDKHKHEEITKMEHLFPEPNTGNQSYPVIITPTANGFILNVVDFDDMSLEADNIQNGIACLQNILSEKLTGIISPPPTPIQDLVLGAGEFVQTITA